MHRLSAVEGEPIVVDLNTAQLIRRAVLNLQGELKPRVSFLSGNSEWPTVQNLVGSVQLTPDLVLDVGPKTRPEHDWAAALLDLMVGENVAFAGETARAVLTTHEVLPDALARIYALQLARAVRREGPLTVLRQRNVSKARLSGRLDVSAWLLQRTTAPHRFPQLETTLTADNEFTGALAWVAQLLANRCIDAQLRGHLRRLTTELHPGFPERVRLDPGIAFKQLPAQWRAYAPAWSTATAVIRRLSPLHRAGTFNGFSLAIEPWPLFETLLRRTLAATAELAEATEGLVLTARPHSQHPLLSPVSKDLKRSHSVDAAGLGRIHSARGVEPDGSLWLGGEVVATFEAKYSVPRYTSSRGHIFQAMTTAAAIDSPLAVLVYPERSESIVWASATTGNPRTVLAVGLDMYSYRRGTGDAEKGLLLWCAIRPHLKNLRACEGIT